MMFLKKALVTAWILAGSLLGISTQPAKIVQDPIIAGTQPVAGFNYYLAGAGVNASASSITFQSLTIPQTGYKLQDSDFSDTFYITFEPGNSKKQEIIACTVVTQNVGGTATVSGCSRGMLPFTPFTASSTYAFPHGGSTIAIFSDPPQLFNEYPAKANNEQISGAWGFAQLPTSTTSTPTNPQQLITLYQFQQATTTGGINASETAKGVSELATGVEAASSTLSGSTGARLSIPTAITTSSRQTTGNFVPVTQTDGTLKSNFIDQTAGYSWSGSNTFSGTNNFTATTTMTTTTIVSSSISNLILGGQSANQLINGNSTTLHYHSAYSVVSTTLVTKNAISGSGLQTAYTFTVPANTFTTSSYSRLLIPWKASSNGSNDTFYFSVTSNGVLIATTTAVTANYNGQGGELLVDIFGLATSTQFVDSEFWVNTTKGYNYQSSNITSTEASNFVVSCVLPSAGTGISMNFYGAYLLWNRY